MKGSAGTRLASSRALPSFASPASPLYRMLRHVEPARVLESIANVPVSTIATAGIFVAGAYFTLTFYDFFSLRTIGAKACALTGSRRSGAFASYSIGHNLGATVFTGGAIRFRIYSAWGLNLLDVAKIAFVTGLTFWLGNAFVLGLGMAFAPDAASAIDHLPPWINRLIGIGGLLVICGYLVWLLGGRREIGVKGVSVVLPNAPLTFVQILIGVFDLGLSAIGDVYAASGLAADRLPAFCCGLRAGNAARLSQPHAGRPRRIRRGNPDCADAISQGRIAGDAADLPRDLLHGAVRTGADDHDLPGIDDRVAEHPNRENSATSAKACSSNGQRPHGAIKSSPYFRPNQYASSVRTLALRTG